MRLPRVGSLGIAERINRVITINPELHALVCKVRMGKVTCVTLSYYRYLESRWAKLAWTGRLRRAKRAKRTSFWGRIWLTLTRFH